MTPLQQFRSLVVIFYFFLPVEIYIILTFYYQIIAIVNVEIKNWYIYIISDGGRGRYFLIFSITKSDIFGIFYQVNLTGGRIVKLYWHRNRLQGI